MSDNKTKKCSLKCKTCDHYDKAIDFCKEKEIEHCSKQVSTDFSKCESYLINQKLIMF